LTVAMRVAVMVEVAVAVSVARVVERAVARAVARVVARAVVGGSSFLLIINKFHFSRPLYYSYYLLLVSQPHPLQ
jgi:hypothetical protein